MREKLELGHGSSLGNRFLNDFTYYYMFAKKSSAQADKQKVSLEKEILFSGSQTS